MAALNQEISQKLRKAEKAQKLIPRPEGDGQDVKVEVREDEEQSIKLQEIIDLLVAAGYFRARIKGLAPFDKVVGGMTWCIESLSVDVDVDLLYQENSTIGQKIALTEKIVAVLPKIKCPHRIEPHQIQGLDFIHVFPVIQWLVKRSVEHRQEHAEFVRSYAINQYEKEFPSTSKKDVTKQMQILENIQTVQEIYRPHRRYKRKTAPPPDIESRVQVTLLEYGHTRGETSRLSQSSDEISPEVIEQQKVEERQLQQLFSSLTAANEECPNFENLSTEDKKQLEKHYLALQSELKYGGLHSQQEQQIAALEEQKIILTESCKKLKDRKDCIEKELKSEKEILDEIRLNQQEGERQLKELESVEIKNPILVREIEGMIKKLDSLKKQESEFRDSCKKEKAKLDKEILELKKQSAQSQTQSDSNTESELAEFTEKVRVLRLKLAKRNRIVATLQRQVDDVPSRTELGQYQRRFLELYNQVAAKHKETKQYYTLYNTLVDKHTNMEKELSLLNSISESYPEAMQSSSGKQEFLKQFQNIAEGVKSTRIKAERRVMEEKYRRDQISHNLQALTDLQRRYVSAVRQLTIECRNYEFLLAQQDGSSI